MLSLDLWNKISYLLSPSDLRALVLTHRDIGRIELWQEMKRFSDMRGFIANGIGRAVLWMARSGSRIAINCITNRIDLIKQLPLYLVRKRSSTFLETIIKEGDLETFKWFGENIEKVENYKIYAAIRGGHLSMVQQFQIVDKKSVIVEAVKYGHLHIIQWLHLTQKISVDSQIYCEAVKGGHFNIIEWLDKNGFKHLCKDYAYNSEIIIEIFTHGNLEMIKWLYNKGYDFSRNLEDYVYILAKAGHLELLQWLYDHTKFKFVPDFRKSPLKKAAKHGHLKIVQWILGKISICPYYDVINAAIRGGHLDIVQWGYNQCREIEEDRINIVGGGHTHIVKWFQEKGWVLGQDEIDLAAQCGFLPLVKWFWKSGYEIINPKIIVEAAEGGYFEMVKWLWDKGVGSTPELLEIIDQANSWSNWKIINWAKKKLAD